MIWHDMIWYDMIWYDITYLTEIGLPPSDSITVHIYSQTILRTTQWTQTIHKTTNSLNWKSAGRAPSLRVYTLAFALQLRKKHGKTLVRVVGECQLARWKQNVQNRAYITIRIHKHNNKNTQLTEFNKSIHNCWFYLIRKTRIRLEITYCFKSSCLLEIRLLWGITLQGRRLSTRKRN